MAPLLGLTLTELKSWITEQGQPSYRGGQLHQWIYEKGAKHLSEITVLSSAWRQQYADVEIGRSVIDRRSVAGDGTIKYLLKLSDGNLIETVGIPTQKRLTVCVSTQVGCPMSCDFCATGKGGYIRNLEPHEIIDQVLTVQEDFKRRVSHIVVMGMGEPLLNLDSLMKALTILNQEIKIGQRMITVSTVGIPKKIAQLAKHQLQITLAVSLHAPNQRLREELIPSAKGYPIDELMADCRDYVKITKRRISFEYILLSGVNDDPEQAQQLSRLIRGFQAHVNLIPYNPIFDASYVRPTHYRVEGFYNVLKQNNTAVSIRYSRGLEKQAACGQLRAVLS